MTFKTTFVRLSYIFLISFFISSCAEEAPKVENKDTNNKTEVEAEVESVNSDIQIEPSYRTTSTETSDEDYSTYNSVVSFKDELEVRNVLEGKREMYYYDGKWNSNKNEKAISLSKLLENAIKVFYVDFIRLERSQDITKEYFDIDLKDLSFSYSIVKENSDFESDFEDAPEFLTDDIEYRGKLKIFAIKDNLILIQIENGEEITTMQYASFYDSGYEEETDIDTYEGGFGILFNQSKNTSVEFIKDELSLYQIGMQRRYTTAELENLSDDELAYTRNEFYARRGYIFKTDKMADYFGKMDWYSGEHEDVTKELSELELYNIYFIKGIEDDRKLEASKDYSAEISELYLIGTKRLLTEKDLEKLNTYRLSYLRNEFFARKGFIFKSKKYKSYFESKDWYKPEHKDVLDKLTDVEKQNIDFLKKLEKEKM